MRALSFKDDPIFLHLCHGAGLRTNRIAVAVTERERKRRKISRSTLAGIRNALLSFPTDGHSRATRLLTAIRGARVLLSLLLRRLTLPRYSATKKKRRTRSRPEHRNHVCAICGSVSRTVQNGKKEVAQDFSSFDRE